jgi:hypothetical protein
VHQNLDAVGEIGVAFETRKDEGTKTRKQQGLSLHVFRFREFANSIKLGENEGLSSPMKEVTMYKARCHGSAGLSVPASTAACVRSTRWSLLRLTRRLTVYSLITQQRREDAEWLHPAR